MVFWSRSAPAGDVNGAPVGSDRSASLYARTTALPAQRAWAVVAPFLMNERAISVRATGKTMAPWAPAIGARSAAIPGSRELISMPLSRGVTVAPDPGIVAAHCVNAAASVALVEAEVALTSDRTHTF